MTGRLHASRLKFWHRLRRCGQSQADGQRPLDPAEDRILAAYQTSALVPQAPLGNGSLEALPPMGQSDGAQRVPKIPYTLYDAKGL
jgi:hypothetical protein